MLSYNFPFQIPIFEKGYEKDPAIVAKEAIQEASRNGSDVVLVDTAGCMQVTIVAIVIVKSLMILWECKKYQGTPMICYLSL